MPYVDFSELKARIKIEQVIDFLKLDVKRSANQLRGSCPVCGGADRTLAITPAKGVWFCFTAQKGGDVISLVAHVLKCEVKDAAQQLAQRFTVPTTVPEATRAYDGQKKLQALDYIEHEHPAVEALGFDLEVAKALGIGFAPRGTMKGFVLIPVRNEQGVLKGYVGVTECKLPLDFQPATNVVPLRKPA